MIQVKQWCLSTHCRVKSYSEKARMVRILFANAHARVQNHLGDFKVNTMVKFQIFTYSPKGIIAMSPKWKKSKCQIKLRVGVYLSLVDMVKKHRHQSTTLFEISQSQKVRIARAKEVKKYMGNALHTTILLTACANEFSI